MSITKYYPNGEGTDPVYDIGTEGLEHGRKVYQVLSWKHFVKHIL
jgi:hypothetical protein